jgi:hypothetical protein
MPLQATSGAASYDAFGGGAAVAPKYIEDFFQTWLRTGTGSSATVTTGLNASINKSLVWTKSRSAATNHKLTDTVRGATKALSSNTTGAEVTDSQGLTAFSSTGYTIGTNTDYNNSGATYVDWQWLATPKFFDVVTYTGNGTSQNISHNLDSVPGCMIIKQTTGANLWTIYHRSVDATNPQNYGLWFQTNARDLDTYWNNTAPTSTVFTVGPKDGTNQNGQTYVAYLFAHNAGGFGLTGTDNVISCGSYTGNGAAGNAVTLGYEPQWLMVKPSSAVGNWSVFDNMRGFTVGSIDAQLVPNNSSAENATQSYLSPTATGFVTDGASLNTSGVTYIYIAIRRGPMKVPTTGTSVFDPEVSSGTTGTVVTTGFPVDLQIQSYLAGPDNNFVDRLRGVSSTSTAAGPYLRSTTTAAEAGSTQTLGWSNTAFQITAGFSGYNTVYYNFRRAPGFFDEVCYTGVNSSAGATLNHNLTVVPEMMIVKARTETASWIVYVSPLGNTSGLLLNSTLATLTSRPDFWNSTTPTATTFSIGSTLNQTGITWVAYLFASCPGVSKVTNFTGTGALQTINCGFTSGARFVLIKRTDSTGNWFVWDSSRGLSSSNDPYLLLNSTAAEVTSTNWVDTTSTGFQVTAASGNDVNINGASYIALAIS